MSVILVLALAGCGSSRGLNGQSTSSDSARPSDSAGRSDPVGSTQKSATPRARPQVIQPVAGVVAASVTPRPADPVGDINAHAPPISQVKRELRLELIAAPVTSDAYINPLQYVSVWGRTDQGVDATMPVGAPILAPGPVKILAIIPNWYAGQPLVYFELLNGPDAGRVQYVAEQITAIAPAGTMVAKGQAIARYAARGTAIEYGWSTLNGVTLARATTGYEEGQVTPAGVSIRQWLDSLGAGAGAG